MNFKSNQKRGTISEFAFNWNVRNRFVGVFSERLV